MQKMNKNFDELFFSLKRVASLTEDYLMSTFCDVDEDTKSVEDSMKYSLFAGGKRIRPYLTLEICKLFGGEEKCALPFAAKIDETALISVYPYASITVGRKGRGELTDFEALSDIAIGFSDDGTGRYET